MITPQEKLNDLAKALEVNKLYFKREDLHPYESHKGRSIPLMIQNYVRDGNHNFAISSSGNAAITAALFVKEFNKNNEPITLQIFVGNNINSEKLSKIANLADEHITLTRVERPLQSLFTLTQDSSIKGLRQSNDDSALIGYEELAKELIKIDDLKAVFIPTSSGTTAQALAESFRRLEKDIEVHIVQTMSCHPIADNLTDVMQTDEESIADAIVDRTALRREKVTNLIKESNGTAYIVTNDEIRSAIQITKEYADIDLSPNSALGVAGLMQAIYTGKKWNGSVACIITGK